MRDPNRGFRPLALGVVMALGLGVGLAIAWVEDRADDEPETATATTAVATTAYTVPEELPGRTSGLPTVETTAPTDDTRTAPPAPLLDSGDVTSFEQLAGELGGSTGVAVASLDGRFSTAGPLQSGAAWSTIKVPLSLAANARSGGGSRTRALMTRAITASDNAAAAQLWSALGPPDDAGAAVEAVLAEAGDTATRVETRVLRPEFSAYGQTDWALAEQARFAAALPCLEGAASVRTLMRQVVREQRWGLGTLGDRVEFKGGWGPGTDGRYLVRQFGLVPLGDDRLAAVAIATIPADGTFGSGIATLDRVAAWVSGHVDRAALTPAAC